MAIYNEPIEKLYKTYGSSEQGLSTQQAKANLAKFGENKLDSQKKPSYIKRFFAQFKNLMVIVLLISAVISTIVSLVKHEYSDLFEGGLIFIIVILNAIIGVVQEKRADNAIALLNKKTEPFTKVYRDSFLTKIPTEELVVLKSP